MIGSNARWASQVTLPPNISCATLLQVEPCMSSAKVTMETGAEPDMEPEEATVIDSDEDQEDWERGVDKMKVK